MPSLFPVPSISETDTEAGAHVFHGTALHPAVSLQESSAPSGLTHPTDDLTIQAPGNYAKNLTQMPGLVEITKPTLSRGMPWHPKGSTTLHPQAGPIPKCGFPRTMQLHPPAASTWKPMLPC